MTENEVISIVVAVLVATVVVLLKNKIFRFGANAHGFDVSSKPPQQKPSVTVEGAISRKGGVTIEDNTGVGVAARDLNAEKDIRISNNANPKP